MVQRTGHQLITHTDKSLEYAVILNTNSSIQNNGTDDNRSIDQGFEIGLPFLIGGVLIFCIIVLAVVLLVKRRISRY